MSTLAEIEQAIESLPPPQVEELAVWLEGHRLHPAGAHVAGRTASVREFFGKGASGRADGAENEEIDRDLAAEAARGMA